LSVLAAAAERQCMMDDLRQLHDKMQRIIKTTPTALHDRRHCLRYRASDKVDIKSMPNLHHGLLASIE